MKTVSYKKTITACYIGNITQAIVTNITPILVIPLRTIYGLSYEQFGLLILINFTTQVAVDIAFAKPVERYGFRFFTVASQVVAVFGFLLFGLTPFLFKNNIFLGFALGTVLFSAGGGLLELLLSPIVDNIPTDEKGKAMAMLHSLYSWGQLLTILATTLFIFIFDIKYWYFAIILWALVPLLNIPNFISCPLINKSDHIEVMRVRTLIKNPVFILAFAAIALGGASEVTIAQWGSAFLEKGLLLPKVLGDMLGLCGFALAMAIGRTYYGKFGHRFNLSRVLIVGSGVASVCYLVLALSPFKWLSVVAVVLSGLCVCLLWPGTLVIASERLPLAGASMFALLAAGGDVGASIGPYFTGLIIDNSMILLQTTSYAMQAEQIALKLALAISAAIPLLCMFTHIALQKAAR